MGKIKKLIVIVLVFTLGFVASALLLNSNRIIEYPTNDNLIVQQEQNLYDGLYFQGNYTQSEAIQFANTWDKNGDWVCVNVNGMSYERAVEVISHEVGHEIFSENCEKNITKCIDAVK